MLRRSDVALAGRRAGEAEAEARILDQFGPAISYFELLLTIGIGLGGTMFQPGIGIARSTFHRIAPLV
jgi:hypothetical protein